jgi:hypothetical protein
MITKISATNQLAQSLEEFVSAAEAFLQNHYVGGSDKSDVEAILVAVTNLKLDIDKQALEQEFELACNRQDLISDYYDSAWY